MTDVFQAIADKVGNDPVKALQLIQGVEKKLAGFSRYLHLLSCDDCPGLL